MKATSMITRLVFLGFSLLIWSNCDGGAEQWMIRPEKGKVYSYELSNYTQRLHETEEKTYQNGLTFDLELIKKKKDGYEMNLVVTGIDIPTDEPTPDYEEFVKYTKTEFIGQKNIYLLDKRGKLSYTNADTSSIESKLKAIDTIADDNEYQRAVYKLTLEEMKKNLFNEWLAYAPDKKSSDKKWKTSNPLNYSDKINSERNFIWNLVEETKDSIVIEGSNYLRNAESRQDLGDGITLLTRFSGIMEFKSRIVLDAKDGMLLKADNTILTNGQISRYPDGMPDGSTVDLDMEPLEGIATTRIRRKGVE